MASSSSFVVSSFFHRFRHPIGQIFVTPLTWIVGKIFLLLRVDRKWRMTDFSENNFPLKYYFVHPIYLIGQNFRHQLEISAVLSDEKLSSIFYFPIHFTRKISFIMSFTLILEFQLTKFSANKTFLRTKFSAASQIFGSFVLRNFVR